MTDSMEAAVYAAAGAALAATVGYIKTRLAKHGNDPTVIEVLQTRNEDLLRMHTENLDRIKAMELEIRDMRSRMNTMNQELLHAKERIGLLTGQLTAHTKSHMEAPHGSD